jgi:hypothetical protein
MANTLTAGTDLSDYVYEVNQGAKTFTLGYTASVSTSTCPLTAVCEIFSQSKRLWESCTAQTEYNQFYSSFTSTSGVFEINYTKTAYLAYYPTTPFPDHNYLVRITITDPLSTSASSSYSDEF